MAVRNESVRISAIDDFTTPVAKMAAAAALFDRTLNDLDGSNVNANRNLTETARSVDTLSTSARRGSTDIDKYSGRLRLIADAAITLGPALIPIGAVAVPAVTGLASAFGFAALGAGTAAVAFQGVGDALKAMSKAQLEPTAENLKAARQAMEQIGPPAREFVTQLVEMGPAFKAVRDAAAAGLFPGLTESLGNLEGVLPRVATLFERIGEAVGDLAADATESLAGPEWEDFFTFLGTEGPKALSDLGSALGSVTHGLAEMWMAFSPLNRDFNGWLMDAAAGFDEWATGLAQTDGFNDFVEYIRTNGPKVADALGSIANAVLQIVEAAAPLGGPVLDILARLSDVIAALADSSIGTPLFALAAGLMAVSRAAKLAGSASIGLNSLQTNLKNLAKTAGALVALEAAGRAIEFFDEKARGAAPGVADLTTALLQANETKFGEVFGGSIREALDAAGQAEGGLSGLSYQLEQIGEQGGAVGTAVVGGLGQLTGLLPGMKATEIEVERAAQAFSALDSALTSIMSTQGLDAAEDAFNGLAESQGLTAAETQQLLAVLPSFGGALAAAGRGGAELDEGVRSLLGGLVDGKGAADGFTDSLIRLNDVLSGRANMRDFEAAIDAATQSLKDNGKNLNINTEAGRANQSALDAIASSALTVAEAMGKAERKNFLAKSRQDFIDAATAMGLTRDAAGQLATSLGLVGRKPAKIKGDDTDFRAKAGATERRIRALNFLKANPKVDANDAQFQLAFDLTKNDIAWLTKQTAKPKIDAQDNASPKIQHVKSLLDGLHDKSLTITTYLATVHRPQAEGGYIAGPGGPTEDRIPAMLSNGEFVMKAAAVSRYGIDAMYAMNEMRLAAGGLVDMTHAKRFAGGGGVGGNTPVLEMFNNLNDNEVERRRRATSGVVDILERERDSRLKMLEEEKQAIADRMSALRDERRAIMESVDARLTDIFATTGKTAADFMGDTTGMTSLQIYEQQQFAEQIADSSQQSPIDILQGNIKDLGELKRLIAQLRKMGLKGDALTALIQSASNDQIQQLLADGEAQHYAQLYNQQQQFSHQVGNQAANAVGVNAELRGLVKENRQIKAELQKLNHRQRKAENQRDEQTRATRQVGGDVANAMSSRSRTASRRATR